MMVKIMTKMIMSDHGDEHGEERIFSTTDSESFTVKGSLNVGGNLINKVDFNFRDSDYTLTEAHEEEGHEDHGDDDHGDEDHGDEHGEEGHAPTVFKNEAIEYGAVFDISNDLATKNYFKFCRRGQFYCWRRGIYESSQ